MGAFSPLIIFTNMKKSTRSLLLIATLGLIAIYFFPFWEIALEAPQYPEGLGFNIWIHKMTGDLRTINGLNHYIGMKTIEPDSISELRYMPYILGFLIFFGFIVFIFNKKILLLIWVILLLIAGTAGAVDFWMWEYDYGHDLDPTAAIKVPGMSYQPPFIGSKKLLNFVAHSYPDVGGIIVFVVGILLISLLVYEYKFNKVQNA
ncbi:MAG: hypothetical protein HGGPFJEG_01057 [Ignavibacteria bacterium]|nr:hypothetical protein [Ignavibacteria bacterium]